MTVVMDAEIPKIPDVAWTRSVYTEIKCHSLLTLDDIVAMVSLKDCIPEVYIHFLNHCYIETEVEVKEIYTSFSSGVFWWTRPGAHPPLTTGSPWSIT